MRNTNMINQRATKRSGKAGWYRRWFVATMLVGVPFATAHADGIMGGMAPMEVPPMGGPMQHPSMPGPDPSTDVTPADATDAPVALPGFPGTPRIYHMGATGFFLDHPEHITLTAKQQRSLGTIKADAQAEQARYRTQMESAENELWSLTGAESPDAAAIDDKTSEIEALRHDQRIAFIHAVGAAAEVLTDEQRKQLVGTASPKPQPAKDTPPTKKGK